MDIQLLEKRIEDKQKDLQKIVEEYSTLQSKLNQLTNTIVEMRGGLAELQSLLETLKKPEENK
jgi:prefoldin subunit 5